MIDAHQNCPTESNFAKPIYAESRCDNSVFLEEYVALHFKLKLPWSLQPRSKKIACILLNKLFIQKDIKLILINILYT